MNCYFRIIFENTLEELKHELVDTTDYMNYTPLHYAAKSGNDATTKLILYNLGDSKLVNATGHRLKTPLHKARTPKIAKLLVDQGGKSIMYCNAMKKEDGNRCRETNEGCKCLNTETRVSINNSNDIIKEICNKPAQSVFSTLLNRNDKTAKVILDEHISDNGEELDSSDLLVVYDMKIFQNESGILENKRSPENDTGYQEDLGIADEMALHSKIRLLNSDLLMHPLSTVFLSLKWSCVSMSFWISLILQMICVLLLSTTTIFQTWAVDKNKTISATCTNASLSNERCYLPEIISMISPTHALVFYCIHVLLSAFTLYFFICEVTQVIYNCKQWSRSKEDKMDFLLILITAFYVVGVYEFSVSSLKHLAAWSTFGGWLKVMLMIGKLPGHGKYVHMFGVVSKLIVEYFCVYVPAILAFSFAFYILLSSLNPFMNPLNAIMKTMVMLVGEIEYEKNFMWNKTHDYGFAFSTQILFLLFLLFGCVVLMNLLVGLAVDEVDVLREKGKQTRREMAVDEINRLEDLFVKGPSITDFLPSCLRDRIRQKFSLFSRLNGKLNPKQSTIVSDNKLCVRPFEPKKKQINDKDSSWLKNMASFCKVSFGSKENSSAAEYPVYFYYERSRRPETEIPTGFTISKETVIHTLDWLSKKDEENKSEIETHSGIDAMEEILKQCSVQQSNIQKIMKSLNIDKDDNE